MSILRKLAKGGLWNAAAQFSSQLIGFMVTILLARMLEPDDFGLVGKVIVITGFIGYFVEFGFFPSLILEKKLDRVKTDTAFWGVVFFTMSVYCIVYFIAPLISTFYNEPRLVPIIRVVFVDFLFRPLVIIPTALESRKLSYDKIAISGLIATFLSGILTFIAALNGFGVWALVVQIVTRSFFDSTILMILVRWYPKFNFSPAVFKRFFNVGKHFTLDNLLKYSSENVDFLVVGKTMSSATLGIYTMAFRLSRYFIMKLWTIFGSMLFPAFRSMNEDDLLVKENYLKVSILMSTVIIPLTCLYIVVVDQLVILLIGDKWVDSIAIVRILSPFIIMESLSVAEPGLFGAKKKIHYVYIIRLIITVSILVFGILGVKIYGLRGIAVIYTTFFTIGFLVLKTIALKVLGISKKNYIYAHLDMILISAGVLVSALIMKWVGIQLNTSPLVSLAMVGTVSFATVLVIARCLGFYKGKKIIFSAIFRRIKIN